MSVDYSIIGNRIKAQRRDRNKTQEDLAEALSVSVGYISQIERGVTKINLETLSAIAAQLGCDLGELVSGVSGEGVRYLERELSERVSRMNARQKQALLGIADVLLDS